MIGEPKRHEDDPTFCLAGMYVCTRDWCCIYGDKGNPRSPWANMKEWLRRDKIEKTRPSTTRPNDDVERLK